MADLSRTIAIIFEGVDNTAGSLANISTGIEKMAGSVETATQPMADLANSVLILDTAAVALGATLLKVAIDSAAKFEQSFTELNTIIKLPADELGKFKDQVIDYSKTSTQSLESINGAIYDAVSAGIKFEDALETMAIAEKLAVGGNADLGDSMKLLVSTVNAYGPSMGDAGKAADIFFKTVEVGATTVPELNSALGQIVPVAAALGVPLEEVGAALATATTMGIGTSEAATGLKAALSNIISPSKQAADAASAMGVGFNASALQSKGLVGLLNELVTATGGNAEEMKKLFGSTEAYTTVMALTSGGAAKLNDNLTAVANSAGAADAAYEKMSNTLENLNQKLTNSIDAVLIRMGDQVLDEYKDLIKSFTGLFGALGDSIKDGAFDAPLGIVEDFLEEFATLIAGVAKALPEAMENIDWSGLVAAFEDLGEAFSGIFGDLDLSDPEDLAKVIQDIIDVSEGMIEVTAGIVEGMQPLFAIIGSVVTAFGELSPEAQKAIGMFLGFSATINTVAGVVGSFGGAITGMISTIKLLSPALLAGGAALAGFELGKWLSEVTGYGDAWDKTIGKFIDSLRGIPEVVGPSNKSLEIQKQVLAEVAETLGLASISQEDFKTAVEDGSLVMDESTGKWVKAGTAADDLGTSLAETTQYFDDWGEGANLSNTALETWGASVNEAAKTSEYWNDALDAVKTSLENGTLSQTEYAAAVKHIDETAAAAGVNLVTMADQEDKAAKSAKELADNSEKFALEWAKLLSEERTAIFEASADIQVAKIEADAERAVAAMDMLARSFESTGEVLTELIGLWAGLEGMDQSQVTEWIEREYAIREKLAQAQIDLITAEVARMEAQTRLLERGGVELTIQSDGLEPELEAFMFKIIDRVRVAVAGSYEEFLLGCGA